MKFCYNTFQFQWFMNLIPNGTLFILPNSIISLHSLLPMGFEDEIILLTYNWFWEIHELNRHPLLQTESHEAKNQLAEHELSSTKKKQVSILYIMGPSTYDFWLSFTINLRATFVITLIVFHIIWLKPSLLVRQEQWSNFSQEEDWASLSWANLEELKTKLGAECIGQSVRFSRFQ